METHGYKTVRFIALVVLAGCVASAAAVGVVSEAASEVSSASMSGGNPSPGSGRDALISFDFFNNDVRSAFQDLSYQAGVVILTDDYVQGYITLSLTDVTVDRAIEVICMKGGYGYKKLEDSLYIIGTIDPSNPTFQKHAVTQVVKLDYANAEDIMSLLPCYQRYMSAKNGVIVVRAWPNQVEDIVADIARLDTPVKQVLGKVIIAEVTAEAKRRLGLDVGSGLGEVMLDFADSFAITAMLSALQVEGKATVKASTSVVVPEGEMSTISIGKEVRRIIDAEGFVIKTEQATVERMEAQTYLKLRVERVTAANKIKISYEVGTQDLGSDLKSELPTLLSRDASGVVTVDNNAVFIIGGLSKEMERTVTGLLPLNRSKEQQDTELLILIVPHVIGTPVPSGGLSEGAELTIRDFVSGVESRLHNSGVEYAAEEALNAKVKITSVALSSGGLSQMAKDTGQGGLGASIGFEGQVKISDNVGVFAGTGSASGSGSSVGTTYGGVVLSSKLESRASEVYVGLGAGTHRVKLGDYEYRSTELLGKVGIDLKIGDIVAGVGYSYVPTEIDANGRSYDMSGAFVKFGYSF